MKGRLTVLAVVVAMLLGCADGEKGQAPAAQAPAPAAPTADTHEGEGASGLGLSNAELEELRASAGQSTAAQPAAPAEEEFEMGNAAPPEPPADEAVLDQSEVPVKLSFERVNGALGQTLTYVIVQSSADSVEVKSVVLNRGNCAAVPSPQTVELPRTLKFGQSVRLLAVGCQSVLEVTVDTNTGEHTFGVSA